MALQMSRLDGSLTKIGSIDELAKLADENEELKNENQSLRNRIDILLSKEASAFKAAEDERRLIILFLEKVGGRLGGIPVLVRLIREVIYDVVIKIKSGDHLNQRDRWR